MKGKLNLRFFAPNVSRVRTRMKEVPADFTSTLRTIFAEAAAEVIEMNQIQFKAAVIQKVAEAYPDVDFTSTANKNAVESVLQDFYTIFVTASKEEFDARFGVSQKDDDDLDSEPVEEEKTQGIAKKKKPVKAKKEAPVKAADNSEFDD
jgi:hypothetical protein